MPTTSQTPALAEAPAIGEGAPARAKPPASGPFVGARPFAEVDKLLFFGRTRETHDLISLIVTQTEVLLYAASGAGKTSLLNARLIP